MLRPIHDDLETWLAAAVLDDLSPEEQTIFNQHIADCARCRSLYEKEKAMNQLIENTLQKERPDLGFEQRMVDQFRKKAPTPQNTWAELWSILKYRPVYGSAATVLLITAVFIGSMQMGLKKSVEDEIHLSGSNTYTGGTTISNAKDSNGKLRFLDSSEASRKHLSIGSGISSSLDALSAPTATPAPSTAPTRAQAQQSSVEHEYAKNTIVTSGPSSYSATEVTAGELKIKAQPQQQEASAVAPTAPDPRKLIRNATADLVVEKYDAALHDITAFATQAGGYVAENSSNRLANGKLQGTLVVKVRPDRLDAFMDQLKSLGDLKNQTLGTEDVTKAYLDTDARMRNAQRMEARLLDILQKNTGKVTDLLQVEKELARVREEIETMQGQLKYWDSLVQLATIRISLSEKDLNQAAGYLIKEEANLALFSKNVETSFNQMKEEAEKASAQIINSELNRNPDNQVTGTMSLLVAPEKADDLIARLKALGRIQTFTVSNERIARDGSDASDKAKVEHDKVSIHATINEDSEALAQQSCLSILAGDIASKSTRIKSEAARDGIEVRASNFERDADGVERANLVFRLPLAKHSAFVDSLKKLGDVKNYTVQRQDQIGSNGPDDNAPSEIRLELFSQGQVVPSDHGFFATVRQMIGEGFGSMMWSIRIIGVALALLVPWFLALVAITWIVLYVRKMRAAKRNKEKNL